LCSLLPALFQELDKGGNDFGLIVRQIVHVNTLHVSSCELFYLLVYGAFHTFYNLDDVESCAGHT
jgi:hypothetical protein